MNDDPEVLPLSATAPPLPAARGRIGGAISYPAVGVLDIVVSSSGRAGRRRYVVIGDVE